MPDQQQLRLGQVLAFYGPLVLTSQMMTLSNPLINLRLARGEEPAVALAAYGVAFGVLVLLNAPLLVAPNVGAGLIKGRRSYHRLRTGFLTLGLLTAAIDLILALTPLGEAIFHGILDATPRVAAEARWVSLSLAPIPVLLGLRGLRSALALRLSRTALLTQATLLRLSTLSAWLFFMPRGELPFTAHIAAALSAGILLETGWIWWATRNFVEEIEESTEGHDLALPWAAILRYGMPLVVAAWTWSALRPLINGILGRTVDSEAAQASFGVLHPLVLLTASALWALQNTGQILATNTQRARFFLKFAVGMTFIFSALVFALGWIPALRDWVLGSVFPLPPELLGYVEPAMRILWLAPLGLGIRAAFKGMIMGSGRTGIISISATTYLLVAAAVGSVMVYHNPAINGAVLGIALVALVEMTEAAILGTVAARRFGIIGGQEMR